MNKVLIATNSPTFQRKITSALPAGMIVRAAADKTSILHLLSDYQPDIFLLDGSLPQNNALHILAEQFPRLPVFIAMFLSQPDVYFQRQASRWGVNLFFSPPYDWKLLKDYFCTAENFTKAHWLHCAQLLCSLNFPAKKQGYLHLVSGLCIYRTNLSQQLENDIYPAVGRMFNIDYRSVEHSIRTVIESAWNQRDPEVWHHFFPDKIGKPQKPPSNKDFMNTIVIHLL